MVYTKIGFTLTKAQKDAIANAYSSGQSVVLNLSSAQLSGQDFLGLTKAQHKKVNLSKRKNMGIVLMLSKTQVSKQGGFLGGLGNLAKLVAPFLLKKVLPALGIAAASGAISGATNKAVRGKGLRTRTRKKTVRTRTREKGLLLGKNSPFKNIPHLNILL